MNTIILLLILITSLIRLFMEYDCMKRNKESYKINKVIYDMNTQMFKEYMRNKKEN